MKKLFYPGAIALFTTLTLTACGSTTSPADPIASPSSNSEQSNSEQPNSEQSNSEQSNSTLTLPQLPPADSYPRKPLELADQVEPGSDFAQFRQRLRQAVADRDADYVKSISTPGIRLSFGDPTTWDQIGLNVPDAPIWAELEKAIGTGCRQYEIPDAAAPETWVCPQVFDMEIEGIAIVGENVSVWAAPDTASTEVGVVSNEEVKLDSETLDQLTANDAAFQASRSLLANWVPVILPSGDRGYVEQRYAYTSLGYRALFRKTDSGWTMDAFVSGD